MDFSPIRKIWIITFSILAILTSSVASSSPLMTFQMLAFSNTDAVKHSSAHHAEHSTVKEFESKHHHPAPISACPDDHGINSSCCSAACANVVTIPSPINEALLRKVQLALIFPEIEDKLLSRQTSLLRPPIA